MWARLMVLFDRLRRDEPPATVQHIDERLDRVDKRLEKVMTNEAANRGQRALRRGAR